MVDLVVRAAVLDDAAAIADVHRRARADYYATPVARGDDREAMWAAVIRQADRVTSVAEESDVVCGFISVHRGQDLELKAIYVAPERFGRGVGSRLYDVFVEQLEPGQAGLLEVWAGNRRAIGFYSRRGWLATSATREGPQGLDFVTYRLPAG
jgi:ribosomal protein S18 acetylase RimI-like enzyme